MKWFVGVFYPGTNPPGNPYDGDVVDEEQVLDKVKELMKQGRNDWEAEIVVRPEHE